MGAQKKRLEGTKTLDELVDYARKFEENQNKVESYHGRPRTLHPPPADPIQKVAAAAASSPPRATTPEWAGSFDSSSSNRRLGSLEASDDLSVVQACQVGAFLLLLMFMVYLFT